MILPKKTLLTISIAFTSLIGVLYASSTILLNISIPNRDLNTTTVPALDIVQPQGTGHVLESQPRAEVPAVERTGVSNENRYNVRQAEEQNTRQAVARVLGAFTHVQDELLASDQILVRPLSAQTIAGYTLLQDIYGKSALLLRVDMPREIYQQGQSSLRYLISSLLLVGLVLGGVTLLLVKRLNLSVRQRQQSEERYRTVVTQASEGIFLVDANTKRILETNAAFENLLRSTSAEVLQLTLYDVIADARESIDRNLQLIWAENHHFTGEWQYRRQDGLLVDVSVNANLISDDGRDVFCIIINEITERKRIEASLQQAHDELEIRIEERTAELKKANDQLRREIVERQRAEEEVYLIQTMTQAISEAQDFPSALGVALRKMCEFTGWSFGEAWIPCPRSTELKYSTAWYGSTQSLEKFRRVSEGFTCPRGTGLPGRVWSSRHPEWIQDVSSESETVFLRSGFAIEAGFKAGLGIPIIAHTAPDSDPEVLAVLVFFMFESCEEDKRQVEIVSTVATQLGSLIQRKKAEEALRSSVSTNRALLNAMPDLMVRISKNGTFVNFKAPKDNELVVFPREFLGKNLYEVLPIEVAQPAIDCVERALETGDIQIFEYQLLLHNDLHDYEARIVVSAKDEVIAIVRDITERKRVEVNIRNALEKEKQLSELKSRFVSTTSHEFRTPLTTILSSAELLERYSHKWTEEKKNTYFQRIQTVAKDMTRLLDDVLLISKVEAGKLEFKPRLLDLCQFCRELVEEMQLTTNTHTIAFRTQNQCTNACMDEKLLRHILSNLLSNAIKYSPQGGTVHFDLVCEQLLEAVFRIQDYGIGIPSAGQVQIFDSFHRASNVGTISGTGLGLAIVKKAVDLHGGKIALKSEVGVGTTFTVTLPFNHAGIDE